jgi:hypothetical protein
VPLEALEPVWAEMPLAIKVNVEGLGTIYWDIPEELRRRLLVRKSKAGAVAAIKEIERALTLFVSALGQALGDRRRALQLSYHLEELQGFIEGKPFTSLKA